MVLKKIKKMKNFLNKTLEIKISLGYINRVVSGPRW